jgi:hypothetical protein
MKVELEYSFKAFGHHPPLEFWSSHIDRFLHGSHEYDLIIASGGRYVPGLAVRSVLSD